MGYLPGYGEKNMKRFLAAVLGVFVIVSSASSAGSQQSGEKTSLAKSGAKEGKESATASAQRPLVLSGSVPMDGVKGRIDHFASGNGRVFISALGNNTVEVINLFGGTVDHTITAVPNPQGVAFSPDANKLFVAARRGNSTSMTQTLLI